jgi:hypothetical protein
MPFQLPPRPVSVLASVLAAGLMLAVAGCAHVTPLGPDAAATIPQPHHLRSPFVLQDMRLQQPAFPGGCPSGSFALSGSPGPCYRDTGKPATVTSAAVSAITSFQPPTPSGQQAVPTQYGFWITVPAGDAPALRVIAGMAPQNLQTRGGPVSTSANDAPIFAISVGGRTWVPIGFSIDTSRHQFEFFLASRSQAIQLQGMLAPAD